MAFHTIAMVSLPDDIASLNLFSIAKDSFSVKPFLFLGLISLSAAIFQTFRFPQHQLKLKPQLVEKPAFDSILGPKACRLDTQKLSSNETNLRFGSNDKIKEDCIMFE